MAKKNIKKGQKSTFTINATYLLKYCWNMVVTAPRTSRLTSLAHFPDQCYQAENQTKKLKNQTFIRPKADPNSLFLREKSNFFQNLIPTLGKAIFVKKEFHILGTFQDFQSIGPLDRCFQ